MSLPLPNPEATPHLETRLLVLQLMFLFTTDKTFNPLIDPREGVL
jgi:hypothetical protein